MRTRVLQVALTRLTFTMAALGLMPACGSAGDGTAVLQGDPGPALPDGGPSSAPGMPGTGGSAIFFPDSGAQPIGSNDAVCGNGIVEPGEECDNGSDNAPGSGCEADCTFTCITNEECSDFVFCNGEEICNEEHVCEPGEPEPDGAVCGQDRICQDGACVNSEAVCGDGVLHSSEECDNGPANGPGTGCEDDCTLTCVAGDPARDCRSNNPCRSHGTCDEATYTCIPGALVPDGQSCEPNGQCRTGECTSVFCGNGVLDEGEDCDDGNRINGDGCDNDCTFSCYEDDDCTEDPCAPATCNEGGNGQLCGEEVLLADGESCGDGLICRSGVCRESFCGDGFVDVDAGEQCDDGNTNNLDGCRDDCTFTCQTSEDCDSGNPCDGSGACVSGGNGQLCESGAPLATGAVCSDAPRSICNTAGLCVASVCGDMIVDPGAGEQCDDGNTNNLDGCRDDCTFTCQTSDDCDTGNPCDGAGACVSGGNGQLCESGTPLEPGDVCSDSPRSLCSTGGLCLESFCGDGIIDPGAGEECDDGNQINGDGCDNDCTFSCTTAADCDDGNSCTQDACDLTTHTCSNTADASQNGSACDIGGGVGTCQDGVCTPADCGNGVVEPAAGEECDKGAENGVPGSGCTANCQFECSVAADCSDGNPCTGTESCIDVPGGKTCQAGAPLSPGDVCQESPRRICDATLSCVASTCGDGFVDTGAGEECDNGTDGNGPGTGCTTSCRFECNIDADCSDGNVCTGEETCVTVTGGQTCQAGTPPAAGTVCGETPRRICNDSQDCVTSTCGDGFVDPGAGEECDNGTDGNGPGTGCTTSCQFECSADADCDDGNPCNGEESCVVVAGGQTCQDGTPLATWTVCSDAPRRLCNESQECVASTCGDGFVDVGAGEECEPPGTSTCNNNCETICDLTGKWASYVEVDVSWPSSGSLQAGSGTIRQWVLADHTQSGTSLAVDNTVCGLEIPDFRISALLGTIRETYGVIFPDAFFDVMPPRIPLFGVDASVTTRKPGGTYSTNPGAAIIGILMDDPLNDPWPDLEGAKAAATDEHDQDGYPGFTGISKSGDGYDRIRVQISLTAVRASHLFFTLRQILELTGTVDSCDAISGSANVLAIDNRIIGCRIHNSSSLCDDTQTQFLDDGKPQYTVEGASFEMVRVGDDATCQTVRSTLP